VKPGASLPCGTRQMRTDATPFIVGQIRRVSFALHSAERRPPEHPLSTFQTVSLGSPMNKPTRVRSYKDRPKAGVQAQFFCSDPVCF
jgi:hypothetical protein